MRLSPIIKSSNFSVLHANGLLTEILLRKKMQLESFDKTFKCQRKSSKSSNQNILTFFPTNTVFFGPTRLLKMQNEIDHSD